MVKSFRGHLRTVRHIAALALLGLVWMISYVFPERAWSALGYGIGRLLGRCVPMNSWLSRRMAQASGTVSLPTNHYADLGRRLFESFRLSRTAQRCVLTDEAKALLGAMDKSGKGVLVVSAHFGHWEAMGLALHRLGYRFGVVSTLGKTDLLNTILKHVRRRLGLTVFDQKGCAPELVSALQSGQHVSLFIDVPCRVRGMSLSFLGGMVERSTAVNRLAKLTNSPCIFVFNRRTKTGMYQINAERVPTDMQPLQWCHNRLEGLVRSAPSQWVWLLDKPRG